MWCHTNASSCVPSWLRFDTVRAICSGRTSTSNFYLMKPSLTGELHVASSWRAGQGAGGGGPGVVGFSEFLLSIKWNIAWLDYIWVTPPIMFVFFAENKEGLNNQLQGPWRQGTQSCRQGQVENILCHSYQILDHDFLTDCVAVNLFWLSTTGCATPKQQYLKSSVWAR